ncbi:MAG: co-chaperone YbbN [Acidimicrobiaceae bacterium]|jgi:putative thioredoxin|nr:co-chaperone YbbN [Acidimicrobiaceae bacterium]|tara:strand:- start:4362 stop:5063 length:702 start_codon:yes stop_codon:yes gene_type:complete
MKSVTDETFNADVIVRSATLPVIVDLWAPWCEPCKSLTPLLESVVASTNGSVELVGVNIDESPQIRETFQVQSIPAVYAFKDGDVVNGFMGAQGEDAIKKFVDGLLPSEQDKIIEALLSEGSEESLSEILVAVPDHEEAVIALAKIFAESNRSDEAIAILKKIPESGETRRIVALARTGDISNEEIIRKLDSLLETVSENEDDRKQYVDLLDVLGPDSEEATSYRRKLASILF